MVRVKDFHELKVWQKAHALTLAPYQSTTDFPREELYGLTGSSFLFGAADVSSSISDCYDGHRNG